MAMVTLGLRLSHSRCRLRATPADRGRRWPALLHRETPLMRANALRHIAHVASPLVNKPWGRTDGDRRSAPDSSEPTCAGHHRAVVGIVSIALACLSASTHRVSASVLDVSRAYPAGSQPVFVARGDVNGDG